MDDSEIMRTAFDLDHRTCLVLLATERFGRLVSGQSDPNVVPVRFALTGERLAIMATDGAGPPGAPGDRVVLEVDGIDERRRVGWSVIVHGRLVASESPGQLDVTILELTGRWVGALRTLPPLDSRAYL
jgi:hypothetical protein